MTWVNACARKMLCIKDAQTGALSGGHPPGTSKVFKGAKSLVSIILLAVLLSGCQGGAAKPRLPEQHPRPDNPSGQQVVEDRQKARSLARLAQQEPGVIKANVVLVKEDLLNNITMPKNRLARRQNTYQSTRETNPQTVSMEKKAQRVSPPAMVALTGLTLERNVSGDAARSLQAKQAVARKLLNGDKQVSRVLVTTEPTLVARLESLATKEGNTGYLRDVNNLLRRMQQQTPPF